MRNLQTLEKEIGKLSLEAYAITVDKISEILDKLYDETATANREDLSDLNNIKEIYKELAIEYADVGKFVQLSHLWFPEGDGKKLLLKLFDTLTEGLSSMFAELHRVDLLLAMHGDGKDSDKVKALTDIKQEISISLGRHNQIMAAYKQMFSMRG